VRAVWLNAGMPCRMWGGGGRRRFAAREDSGGGCSPRADASTGSAPPPGLSRPMRGSPVDVRGSAWRPSQKPCWKRRVATVLAVRMAEAESRVSPKIVSFRPQAIWRVHRACYRPTEFHSGSNGNARFSPIRNANGDGVSILCWRSPSTWASTKSFDRPWAGRQGAHDLSKLVP
jgi:hypothetical protein